MYARDEMISELRGHMNLPNRSLTIRFGETTHTIHAMLYAGLSHSLAVAPEKPGCGATRILSGSIGRDNLTRHKQSYSRDG